MTLVNIHRPSFYTWYLVTEEHMHKLYKLPNCAYNTKQIQIGSTKNTFMNEKRN
jgi:hypothetical protein